MNRYLDISKIPTPQLKAIRTILVSGATSVASKAGDAARKLRVENAALKKAAERKGVCESAGLDWEDGDDLYYGNMSDENFFKTIQMFVLTKREATASVRLNTFFSIPNLRGRDEELEGSKYIAEQLKLRKNGDKG